MATVNVVRNEPPAVEPKPRRMRTIQPDRTLSRVSHAEFEGCELYCAVDPDYVPEPTPEPAELTLTLTAELTLDEAAHLRTMVYPADSQTDQGRTVLETITSALTRADHRVLEHDGPIQR